jgi:hypothetical protein
MDATQTSRTVPPIPQWKAKHTILFLAANPLSTDRLALDQEARAIQAELERGGHREEFELVTRWAVEPLDLLRELRRLEPTIVHFSGHGAHPRVNAGALGTAPGCDIAVEPALLGGKPTDADPSYGLYLQGTGSGHQLVSAEALAETLGAAGASVRVVVLNAGYSDVQFDAILQHVDCVVGMIGTVNGAAAQAFAIGFYGGLGEGDSIAAAYRQGCAAIGLQGLHESGRPRLRTRHGTQAERLALGVPVPRIKASGTASVESQIGFIKNRTSLLYGSSDEISIADNIHREPVRSHLRWCATGIGTTCVLSGVVASVAWQMPVTGLLGMIGAGLIVISLALTFERIPDKDITGVLKFSAICIVVFLLGLAYADRCFINSNHHNELAVSLTTSKDVGRSPALAEAESRAVSRSDGPERVTATPTKPIDAVTATPTKPIDAASGSGHEAAARLDAVLAVQKFQPKADDEPGLAEREPADRSLQRPPPRSIPPRQPATTTDKTEIARQYVEAGLAAQSSGDYDTAITFYTKAYELVPHPVLLYNLAQAHRLAKREDRASALYQRYLSEDPYGVPAQTARDILNEIAARKAEAKRAEDARNAAEARPIEDARKGAEVKQVEDARRNRSFGTETPAP